MNYQNIAGLSSSVMTSFSNLASGYYYAKSREYEKAAAEGKNYSQLAFSQIIQVFVLGATIEKVAEGFQGTTKSALMSAATAIRCLCIPVIAVASYMRAKADETELKSWTFTILNFFSEHIGEMVHVAMFVSAIALIAFGNPIHGSLMLAGLIYQAINSQGLIPQKMDALIEKIMPIPTNIIMFIYGNWLMRITIAYSLATELLPNILTYEKIDSGIHRLFGGFSIEACNAPLSENRQMTYEEITRVLNDKENIIYKFDPAHCTKKHIADETNSSEKYIEKIWTALETQRYNLIKKVMDEFSEFFKDVANEMDIFTQIQDLIFQVLSTGFYSTIEQEKNSPLIVKIQQDNPFIFIMRNELFQNYMRNIMCIFELSETSKDKLGANGKFEDQELLEQIKTLISTNPSLNENQQKQIYALIDDGISDFTQLENRKAFVRLFYVMIGIYSNRV